MCSIHAEACLKICWADLGVVHHCPILALEVCTCLMHAHFSQDVCMVVGAGLVCKDVWHRHERPAHQPHQSACDRHTNGTVRHACPLLNSSQISRSVRNQVAARDVSKLDFALQQLSQ